MTDLMMPLSDPGTFELGRRLEAYAERRLSPAAEGSAAMRAAIMAAAANRPALARRRPATMRRAASALLAATLAVGPAAGSVFAARAGGPLYGMRIWAEALTLPASGIARIEAEVGRLDARLDEARAARQAGDLGAVEAALRAYADITLEAAAGVADDRAAAVALAADLADAAADVDALADGLPATVHATITHDVASGQATASEHATDPSTGLDHRTPPGASGNGAAGNGAAGNANGHANGVGGGAPRSKGHAGGKGHPGSTPDPDPSAKPDKTANPHKPVKP